MIGAILLLGQLWYALFTLVDPAPLGEKRADFFIEPTWVVMESEPACVAAVSFFLRGAEAARKRIDVHADDPARPCKPVPDP